MRCDGGAEGAAAADLTTKPDKKQTIQHFFTGELYNPCQKKYSYWVSDHGRAAAVACDPGSHLNLDHGFVEVFSWNRL
jgi:hypothetical protein